MLIILTPLETRVVQMGMGIDCSREHIFSCRINDICRLRLFSLRQDCGNPAVFHSYISFCYIIRRNNLSIFN